MNETTLFVYGSLLVPLVRRRVIGREVPAQPARILGHERRCIRNEIYPAIRPRPGASVAGELLLLTPADLARLDEYEGGMYVRRPVTAVLADGTSREAHAYLIAPHFEGRLSNHDWSLDEYQRRV